MTDGDIITAVPNLYGRQDWKPVLEKVGDCNEKKYKPRKHSDGCNINSEVKESTN